MAAGDKDRRSTHDLDEESLLHHSDLEDFRERWETVQTNFVDDPRRAVSQADELVADTMQQISEMFSRERARLEDQWTRGDEVSTEDLRVSLQRYRSFFNRLLRI